MTKRIVASIFVFISVVCSLWIPVAQAGKIVITFDEWTLSDSGFFSPNDPGTFALNIGNWFTGGQQGDFLVATGSWSLTGSQLVNTMTSAGHTWSVNPAAAYDPSAYAQYDAIFLDTGVYPDSIAPALVDYVNDGGNVYLAAGAGQPELWNPFLAAFGFSYVPQFTFAFDGSTAVSSDHVIFNGVDYLFGLGGNEIVDLLPDDPRSQVLVSVNGHGLYAVYDSSVPEPSTMLLLGSGLVGLVGLNRRRKA